jgi:putative membrane protein
MKSLVRKTLFNAFSIFLISQVISGMKIEGGLMSYLIGGLALTVLFFVLKPILKILTLPLNIITLGMFSFVINVIIFYLLTVFVTTITISAFTFPGLSFAGFVIPSVYVNTLFAFILISFLQSVVVSFLTWLMKK